MKFNNSIFDYTHLYQSLGRIIVHGLAWREWKRPTKELWTDFIEQVKIYVVPSRFPYFGPHCPNVSSVNDHVDTVKHLLAQNDHCVCISLKLRISCRRRITKFSFQSLANTEIFLDFWSWKRLTWRNLILLCIVRSFHYTNYYLKWLIRE